MRTINLLIVIFILFTIYILHSFSAGKYNHVTLMEILIAFLLALLILYLLSKKTKMISVKSVVDDQFYDVMNLDDKEKAANMLGSIRKNINILTKYLYSNSDGYEKFKPYIVRLHKRFPRAKIYEGANDGVYTSYSVNKGDELIFCLRSIANKNKLHDLNLVMYVALHEIAHIACPEVGHGKLFVDIFEFITKSAIRIGIYEKIDFKNIPTEYCGLVINGSIV